VIARKTRSSTATERVNYFFTTTSDKLKEAMVFMRDAVVAPLFDAKELERERVVVTGEIDRNEANPFYHFFHDVQERVWWKYPSYKDPLGNRQTVLGATTEPLAVLRHPALPATCRDVAALAVTHFDKAAEAMAVCSRWAMRPAAVMGAFYRGMLDALLREGWRDPSRRVRLSKSQKLRLVLRHGLL